jgi:hypothetical protein
MLHGFIICLDLLDLAIKDKSIMRQTTCFGRTQPSKQTEWRLKLDFEGQPIDCATMYWVLDLCLRFMLRFGIQKHHLDANRKVQHARAIYYYLPFCL